MSDAPGWRQSHRTTHGSLDDAVDAQLDDEALGNDIDQEVAAELGAVRAAGYPAPSDEEDLPFDPDDARAFDCGVERKHRRRVRQRLRRDRAAATAATTTSAIRCRSPAATTRTAPRAVQQRRRSKRPCMGGPIVDEVDDAAVGGARAESLVEDDLEEVDFYAGQGMYAEAMDSLRGLLERYPESSAARSRRCARSRRSRPATSRAARHAARRPRRASDRCPRPHGTDALDLDEIEEVSADDISKKSSRATGVRSGKRKPTVMLEKPVDEGDAETHYDLGLAYKEMGLFDEAIKAFEKALRAPGREVQCRVMIGMCHRERAIRRDAIHQFKQGLHANASDRERLSLYYEIGITYERWATTAKRSTTSRPVLKRDPSFADSAQRAESPASARRSCDAAARRRHLTTRALVLVRELDIVADLALLARFYDGIYSSVCDPARATRGLVGRAAWRRAVSPHRQARERERGDPRWHLVRALSRESLRPRHVHGRGAGGAERGLGRRLLDERPVRSTRQALARCSARSTIRGCTATSRGNGSAVPRWGARVVDVPYVQPALGAGLARDRGLRLVQLRGRSRSAVAARRLRDRLYPRAL